MAWGARGVPVPGCPFASREEAQRVLEEEAASLGFCVVAIGIVEDPQRAARLAQIRGIAATAKAVSIATGKGGGETDLDFLLSEIDRLGVEVERLKKLVGEK
jgi:methylmalonyl-CoA mutase cobalamin-binding subunit